MLASSDGATIDGFEKKRADTIDLTDNDLKVDISDSVSEKDGVKFTIHTKTKMAQFSENDFSVARVHEEFIWLYDHLINSPEYAGLIIPPPPPRPDFDASRAKLQKMSENENTLTKEEYEKMKVELEAEYLALFKKTVSMHEVFLQRLAAHPIMRNDENFITFLKYKDSLSVRSKNAKEQIDGFFKSLTKTADEVLLANQKETDEDFESAKRFLVTYHTKIKDSVGAAEKATRTGNNVPKGYIKVTSSLLSLGTVERSDLQKFFVLLAEFFEKSRKLESRIQSDIDLKLTDTLRYYAGDSKAALDLMYRRARCFSELETANKNLDRARARNKEIQQAETNQQNAKEKFENMSVKAKEELNDFKIRRVQMFKKHLVELSELQIKHTKAQIQTIKTVLQQAESL